MGFEQGEIELQPLTGGVDTVTWTAKKGSATTRSCGQHRTLNFIILIQAIIIVVLGMRHTSSYISSQTKISSQRKKNENGSNTQTSSNSPPSSSNKTRNQSDTLRCGRTRPIEFHRSIGHHCDIVRFIRTRPVAFSNCNAKPL